MIYDLTMPISPALVRWPGDPAVQVQPCSAQEAHLRVARWTLGSHTGTHVDTPRHVSVGEQSVDELDPHVLIGPCRLLDMTAYAVITAPALAQYDLAGVERLLIKTQNSARLALDTTTFFEDFVGLDLSAAQFLVERGVKLVGIDGLSIECWEGDGAVHAVLLAAGVIVIETLALAAVTEGTYCLICAPLKLLHGDGAPARVFLYS